MLLKSQGLTIDRPQRAAGIVVGAAATAISLALAGALTVRAATWPISFPQFLAYLGAGLLVVLGLTFGFWTYGCASLRYVMDKSGLVIRWGPLRHFVSMDSIEGLTHGRGEHRPKVEGLSWWGYHVGRGRVEGLGRVLFFSTHLTPEDLVYVRTAEATYALSPRDPLRFIEKAQRFQSAPGAGQPRRQPAVQRDLLAAHPIWADRTAQALLAAAVVLNLALWGFLSTVYPHLNNEITLEFPPLGEITTLRERIEILRIPGTAAVILALNLLTGLAFQWKERAATYLLLSGAVFFQALFWIAAAIAVYNA